MGKLLSGIEKYSGVKRLRRPATTPDTARREHSFAREVPDSVRLTPESVRTDVSVSRVRPNVAASPADDAALFTVRPKPNASREESAPTALGETSPTVPPLTANVPLAATNNATSTALIDEAAAIVPPTSKLAQLRAKGHLLTFVLLFFFTLLVYTRPADWWLPQWPLYSLVQTLTFVVGLLTLGLFWPWQLLTEGRLTRWPREVYYVLAMALMGLLAMPLADQDRWWARFTWQETFIRAVLIFIVMVNVLRTEKRWRTLLFVPWAVGVYLAWTAFNDYLTGKAALEGYRIEGALGGMFGNPNDLSQHLVTMLPITIGLLLAAPRSLSEYRQGTKPPAIGFFTVLGLMIPRFVRRAFYVVSALILLLGTMVTFSRSGFLATTTSALVMTWKFGRKRRGLLMCLVLFFAAGFLVAAPGQYRNRVLSIVDDDLEVAKGSASSRKDLLKESIKVTLRHPILGLGMGNFRLIYKKQTHNAFTQVSSEMGLIGFTAYLLFLLAPMRRLYEIEQATAGTSDQRRFFYLAVGLQAAIAAYLVGSFFGSIAYYYNIYYLIGFAVAFRLLYYQAHGLPAETLSLPQPEAPPQTPVGARPAWAGT